MGGALLRQQSAEGGGNRDILQNILVPVYHCRAALKRPYHDFHSNSPHKKDGVPTDSWFGYNIQKMASVSASMATLAFNRAFKEQMRHFFMRNSAINQKEHRVDFNSEEDKERCRRYSKAITKDALFDSRVFTLPKEEVCNCLIWRQQDAIRNSIEAAGQAFYSAKELHKKNQANILEMLLERGIDWEDYPHCMKYGSCCYKQIVGIPMEDRIIERRRWVVDKCPPIFSKEREYVEVWL